MINNSTLYKTKSIYKGDGIYKGVDALPPVAAMTLRFKFSDLSYSPVVAGVGSSGTWQQVKADPNIWDWTRSGVSFSNSFDGAFTDNDNLVSVIAAGDTSTIRYMGYLFNNCTALVSIPLFDTSSVLNMSFMFRGCTSLASVPLFDTSAVTNFGYMLSGCTALESIPLFDTSVADNVNFMFNGCTKVESGALALYQQMSTQTTLPGNHSNTFYNCGSDTTTGAAELAQIPPSWGGTAENAEVLVGGVYYKTIVIGDSVWMAENLRYETTNSVGRENNPAYGQYYGLDDITELQSVIPTGWRIPSVDDGDIAPLYTPPVEDLQSTEYAAKWPNATNATGFSAVPGGAYQIGNGTFPAVNEGKALLLTNDLSRTFIIEPSSRTLYAFGNNAQYYRFNIRLCKNL